VVGKDEEKAIIEPNRFINLFSDFAASSNIVRGKPASDTVCLQIRMKTVCKWLIDIGIAYEARVKRNGSVEN
jgi:hypothetical protein